MMVILATSMAMSLPPPMAMLKSAWARAALSLMPSPTMATYTGLVVGDACFAGNLTGGGLIVSGQHVDFDAGGVQLADGADGGFLYPVCNSGYCQHVFFIGKPDDGLRIRCQAGGFIA